MQSSATQSRAAQSSAAAWAGAGGEPVIGGPAEPRVTAVPRVGAAPTELAAVLAFPELTPRPTPSRGAPGLTRPGGSGGPGRAARRLGARRADARHGALGLSRGGGIPAPAVRSVRGGCSRSAPASAPLRLTDRGRHVLAGLALVVGLALCALVGPLFADGPALQTVGQGSVVVESGDTLWSIAASVAGTGQDVRAVIDEIRRVNGLAGSDLVPGHVLRLP